MRKRIMELVSGNSSLIPVSEDQFWMFGKYAKLQNSTIVVWKADIESAQNIFLLYVWEIVEEILQIKSIFQNITNDNYEEIEGRPFHSDIFMVPMSEVDKKNRLIMPFFKNWYEVYIKKATKEETPAFFIENFPLIAWATEIILVAFLPCVFWTSYYVCRKFSMKTQKIEYGDCVIHVLSLVTNQGPATEAPTFSIRFLTFVVTLFAFLISVWYASLLIASQAVSIQAPALSSIEDVKTRRTHEMCTSARSWAADMFRVNVLDEDSEFLPEWKGLINGNLCPDNNADLLKRTCTEKIVSLVLFKHYTHLDGIRFGDCVVIPFKTTYFNELALLLAGTRFPYIKSIDRSINRMRDFGIIQYFWIKTKIYIPPIDRNEITVPVVKFGHIFELLIAYLVCIFCSVLILYFLFNQTKLRYKYKLLKK